MGRNPGKSGKKHKQPKVPMQYSLNTFVVDAKSTKSSPPWMVKGEVTRRDMDPVSVNSPGPRQKYSTQVGNMATSNIDNLIKTKGDKMLASAVIQSRIEQARTPKNT